MGNVRNWCLERLDDKGLTPERAKAGLIHLDAVLKTVNATRRLGLAMSLTGFTFRKGEARQCPPFHTDWTKDKMLATGALDEPHLASACPRPIVSLGGISLEAFRECLGGVPRNAASLSATVNRHLRENGRPEPDKRPLFPEHLKPIVTPYLGGDKAAAFAQWQKCLPLINQENRQCGLRACKTVYAEGGVITSDHVRHPLRPLSDRTRDRLLSLCRDLDLIALRWGK